MRTHGSESKRSAARCLSGTVLFHPGHCPALAYSRARHGPGTGGPGISSMGHPRTSRAAASLGRWRPVSPPPAWGATVRLTARRARHGPARHSPSRAQPLRHRSRRSQRALSNLGSGSASTAVHACRLRPDLTKEVRGGIPPHMLG